MKKLFTALVLLLAPAMAFAGNPGNPVFQSVTTATLTGLTTPLSVAQGGTGQTSLNALQLLNAGCINIIVAGGNAGGATDNTAALTAAEALLGTHGGCIYFPQGVFEFTSQQAFSYPVSIYSLSIVGAGVDATEMYFPTATGGFNWTLNAAENSFHFRDFTIATGVAGGGTAIQATNTVSLGDFLTSDITRVTVRGHDGASLSDYWNKALAVTDVSGVNFEGDTVYGNGSGAGQGIVLNTPNSGSNDSIVYNIHNFGMFGGSNGLVIGSGTQGITVDQANYTNIGTGISVNASATLVDQIAVTNSQFNASGNQIALNAPIQNLQIANDLFYITTGYSGVAFSYSSGTGNNFQATNNVFQGVASSNSNFGINYAGTSAWVNGDIVGNSFAQLNAGVSANSAVTGIYSQNTFASTVATPYAGFGTANSFGNSTPTPASFLTAPTVASGFGTSPSIAKNNGTAAFNVTIGSSPGSTGTLTMPAAANGWACSAQDTTTQSASVSQTKETAYTTASVTFTQFNDVMAATAWVAADNLAVQCAAF